MPRIIFFDFLRLYVFVGFDAMAIPYKYEWRSLLWKTFNDQIEKSNIYDSSSEQTGFYGSQFFMGGKVGDGSIFSSRKACTLETQKLIISTLFSFTLISRKFYSKHFWFAYNQ